MESIKQYVMSILAVTLLCSIVKKVPIKQTAFSAVLELLCGVLIVVTVISPWKDFELPDFQSLTGSISGISQSAIEMGTESAANEVSRIIKEQTCTYILEKAASLNAKISVDVTLDERQTPNQVDIQGEVSPYAKAVISDYISQTLAIPEENQTWN